MGRPGLQDLVWKLNQMEEALSKIIYKADVDHKSDPDRVIKEIRAIAIGALIIKWRE